MNLFGLSFPDVQKFILIFVRLATILAITPFYGEKGVPMQLKLGLALILAIAVSPLVTDDVPLEIDSLFGFGVAFLQSLIAGLIIGFIPLLLFAGVQFGGELSGFQMGFGITSVLDPLSQVRMSLIAQFEYIIAFLIFITINGHLYLLKGIVYSFQVVPLIGASFPEIFAVSFIEMTKQLFIIGLKIAAPIMVAIIVTNIGLGILGRTMPQMNIFIVGFPLQIGIGLITLGMSVPVFAFVFEKLFHNFYRDWLALISLL
jgi:flagellar biosynthesis protein FliR